MSKTNWSKHQELAKNAPASELLIEAWKYVSNIGNVVDLGDAGLKDVKYLREKGFDVTLVDETIQSTETPLERLHLHTSTFDQFTFATENFDLVTTMFTLPFNHPERFNDMFSSLKRSLKSGDIFCGQFFGERDGWSANQDMTFHAKEQVNQLLENMHTISFVEVEKDSKTADGNPKHRHLFHVIARK